MTVRPQKESKVPQMVEMAGDVPGFPLLPLFWSPPTPSDLYGAALIYVQAYFKFYIYIYIYIYIYTHTQGPPKKCIHTLTKEN
jgi:hypothetical protein